MTRDDEERETKPMEQIHKIGKLAFDFDETTTVIDFLRDLARGLNTIKKGEKKRVTFFYQIEDIESE